MHEGVVDVRERHGCGAGGVVRGCNLHCVDDRKRVKPPFDGISLLLHETDEAT